MRWDCTGGGEQDRIGRRFQVAARVLDFILGVMESHWRVSAGEQHHLICTFKRLLLLLMKYGTLGERMMGSRKRF